ELMASVDGPCSVVGEPHGRPHEEGVYLTPDQLAVALNVSRAWVMEQARYGDLPHLRLGHRVIRFDADDVLKWLGGRRSVGAVRVAPVHYRAWKARTNRERLVETARAAS